ncbi:MAG: nitroreductase family deazaflavin-dependent oxidoreductase [Anaerolineae bacterium]|nr:nitroreductase family deazaflavin-dependent oxidoreductase [Anaerolineae bacterium]
MRLDRLPRFVLRWFKLPPQVLYAVGLGPLIGRVVLLLTTTGRKSGLERVTPLQYEDVDGVICAGAMRGARADWVRNLQANPHCRVRVKRRAFTAQAEVVTEVDKVADFLELRLRRHPRMIGAMMRAEGLPAKPDRRQLEMYAGALAVVVLHPVDMHPSGE